MTAGFGGRKVTADLDKRGFGEVKDQAPSGKGNGNALKFNFHL